MLKAVRPRESQMKGRGLVIPGVEQRHPQGVLDRRLVGLERHGTSQGAYRLGSLVALQADAAQLL